METQETKGNDRKNKLTYGIIGFIIGFVVSWILFDGSLPNSQIVPSDHMDHEEVEHVERAHDHEEEDDDDHEGEGEHEDETDAAAPQQEAPTTPEPSTPQTPAAAVTPQATNLFIADQAAGTSVTINSASLMERSWIVIYEETRGRPGRILGARRFPEGIHANITVDLLRGTLPNNIYYGMVHGNDGNETFDLATDEPLTTQSGDPIITRFKAEG